MHDVISRLERLEGQNRRLRVLCLAAFVTAPAAALVLPAWADRPEVLLPSIVEARKFVVRDDLGHTRAVLGLRNDKVTLSLRRGDGTTALELGEEAMPYPLR